jgi:ATP-dependent RNA helicase HelY
VLARIFHESDLLCAAAMSDGLFDDLQPPDMAGLASMLTYEHRSKEPPPDPWYPTPAVRERAQRLVGLARHLAEEQAGLGLDSRPAPDPSFLAQAHAWAAGWSFEDVLDEDSPLSPGDFVRNVRTLIDLLGQIGDVAPNPATARSARAAAGALRRGVVAAGSEPTQVLDPEPSSGGDEQ